MAHSPRFWWVDTVLQKPVVLQLSRYNTGEFKGCGFVDYSNTDAVDEAIKVKYTSNTSWWLIICMFCGSLMALRLQAAECVLIMTLIKHVIHRIKPTSSKLSSTRVKLPIIWFQGMTCAEASGMLSIALSSLCRAQFKFEYVNVDRSHMIYVYTWMIRITSLWSAFTWLL